MAAPAVTVPITRDHHQEQLAIRRDAVRDVVSIWSGFNIDNIDGSWASMMTGLLAVTERYHRLSTDAADRYYTQLREASGLTPRPSRLAEFDRDQVVRNLMLLGPIYTKKAIAARRPRVEETALVRVVGAVTYLVMAGGRDTIRRSIQEDPDSPGYQRITTGTCDFCRELAAKGTQEGEFEAHANCGCVAEPVFRPPERISQEQVDEWFQAMRPKSPRYDPKILEETRALLNETDEGRALFEFIDKWQNAETSARFRSQVEKYLNGQLSGPAAERVEAILTTLNRGPRTDIVLHRGMAVRGKIDNVAEKYKVGDTVDMNLSSFTYDRSTATRYARQRNQNLAQSTNSTKVVIEWTGSKQGVLPIENAARDSFHFGQKEVIGGGRFRIVEVKKANGGLNIKVEQLAPLG